MIDGCGRPAWARGWCGKHYTRWHRHGDTTKCGTSHSLKHGHRWTACRRGKSPTYQSWAAMKARCLNPGRAKYADYGGRGIKVCDRWLGSFSNFLADMGERPEGMTLDRIDNDGDYGPGNVRWATPKEQRANQRPKKRRSKSA